MSSSQLIKHIFGNFQWTPPVWIKAIASFLGQHIKRTLAALCILIMCISGAVYYFNSLPSKIKIDATFSEIKLTSLRANAKPSQLAISFSYDRTELDHKQSELTHLSGSPSVARIDLLDKKIDTGIRLLPAKPGVWQWQNDNTLQFTPETDWSAGTDYRVEFDPSLFAEGTILSKQLTQKKVHFSTPQFTAKIKELTFYQDPKDSSIRRVISTVAFSHPIDKASFESSIQLNMQSQKKAFDYNRAGQHDFTVTYHKNLREAYIQSKPITLQKQSQYMRLVLDKGVGSLLGGTGLIKPVTHKVLIPDVYNYLKVSDHTHIVRNTENEPEQVLTLTFTDEIAENELLKKITLYQLPPKFSGRFGNVNEDILRKSTKLPVVLVPNERRSEKIFNFRLDVAEKSKIYLKIDGELISVNDFVHARPYRKILRIPNYPKEVGITGEGNILTYSGDHQLGITSRGVTSLKFSVGKLLANKVSHLVSQTQGDITNPAFRNWLFNEEDITEYKNTSLSINAQHPKQANYSSLDLTDYLPQEADRFGLFFVNVKAFNDGRQKYEVASDKRLILVTDLGIIVKDNADQSHQIFVQSIQNGLPVEGATVELLGKNGLAIASGVTDAKGHVLLPSTASFKKEKTPIVYIVKATNDMSFIPFKRVERQVNLSKFDIGGVKSSTLKRTALNGFLFSDRGIYRPGETVNLGVIVKNSNLSNVENIPLELVITDPKNKRLKKHRYQVPEKGFYDFQFSTETSSETGQYNATLYLINKHDHRSAKIGSTTFKVEEFQPDTMKITSQLENIGKTAWSTATSVKPSITLTNLFGSPAQDRKVTAKAIITPYTFNFPEYQGYYFTETAFDHEQSKQQALKLNKALTDKRTDATGKTTYDIDLKRFTQGTYQLLFLVEGFEPSGGRSVKTANTMIFSPLKRIVGYKPNGSLDYISANKKRSVHFVAIDNSLKPQVEKEVTLKLIEVESISTLVKQANGTYKYQTVKKEKPISETNIELSEQGFEYQIDSATAGDFIVELHDNKGQRLSKLNYSVAGFANLAGKIDKNAELQLKLDKADYFPGDTIEMSIKAPYKGSGLIAIETDKVEHFKWFKTEHESTVQKIVLPENIEGTAYVSVAFVRDIGSKAIFTSPLSYAVQPFSIDKSKRQVDIELAIDSIVRPGKAMDITFKTSKNSRIAVFAIDEGILQVANYQTPKPIEHYLKKRALDVKTHQILDLILPDFNLIKALSASGGGSRSKNKLLANNLNPFARKLDKPAVFWSGIYSANQNEQTVQFEVPNTFSGELRVMAIAVADEAIGSTSQSTLVRGPFVISPNVLSSAAPGDEFDVTIGVANLLEGSGKQAAIDVSISSTDHLRILGNANHQLNIDEGGEAKLTVRMKALGKLGAANITITAQHKQESLQRSASLSVRPSVHYRTELQSGYSDERKTQLTINRTLYKNLAKQTINASSSPLVLTEGLMDYLDAYNHSCTEQIISKVFPMVGLLAHPAYSVEHGKLKHEFETLLDKLRSRQTADGGFSFWPRGNVSSVYPSVYAMHFLIEAQHSGYPVPRDMLNNGKAFLNSLLHAQKSSDISLTELRNRANAIYLLTRMGVVTSNFLIDLEERLLSANNKAWEADILWSYMAATYQLLQNKNDANRLIKRYQLNSSKQYEYDDFRSPLALDAQQIYLLSKHFPQRAKTVAGDQVIKFIDKINKGDFNTISSAYTVLAIGAYSQLNFDQTAEQSISVDALNDLNKTISLDVIAKPFPQSYYPVGTKKITINAKTPIFYTHVQSGFDQHANQQDIKAVNQGIELYREYLDADGKVITRFEQGKEITVRLKVRSLSKQRLSNIAIVDLLPGGFEIIRESISRSGHGWKPDYVDIREDRLVYYGSVGKQLKEISYQVKLTASGVFTTPSATAESMYDRSIKAVTQAGKFTVSASQ